MGNTEGKPIILVHGLRDPAKSLFSVGIELAEKYLFLISDLRGHGASPRFSPYQMPDFLGDLHEINVSRYSALFPETIRCLMLVEGLGPRNKKDEEETDYVRYYRANLESRLTNARKRSRP